MQVPEAQAAAQTMVVGFADMFLPAVLATGIEAEITRFIIAALSVTQLIYICLKLEVFLLGSEFPLHLKISS